MTARHKRGAALLVGSFAGLLFTLIAAVQVAGWTIGAVEHTSTQVVPGPVKVMTVDAGPGDITILPSQSADVDRRDAQQGDAAAPRACARSRTGRT